MRRRRAPARVKRRNDNVIVFRKGHSFSLSPNPPQFVSEPWFSLTVRFENPATEITYAGLYTALQSQLSGLSFVSSLAYVRLMHWRCWGPIPVTNTPIRVTFFDIFDEVISGATGNAILRVAQDYGNQVSRACVSYAYSTAQQQKAVFVGTGLSTSVLRLTGFGAGSVLYLRLLWRPASGVNLSDDESADRLKYLVIE